MKKIYVAHPFGGREIQKVIIGEICRRIIKLGAMPISPVHMFGFMDDGVPDERKRAMEFCEEIIQYMDELWLCGAWEKSEGCQREHNIALLELVPVYEVAGWSGDRPLFKDNVKPSWW